MVYNWIIILTGTAGSDRGVGGGGGEQVKVTLGRTQLETYFNAQILWTKTSAKMAAVSYTVLALNSAYSITPISIPFQGGYGNRPLGHPTKKSTIHF